MSICSGAQTFLCNCISPHVSKLPAKIRRRDLRVMTGWRSSRAINAVNLDPPHNLTWMEDQACWPCSTPAARTREACCRLQKPKLCSHWRESELQHLHRLDLPELPKQARISCIGVLPNRRCDQKHSVMVAAEPLQECPRAKASRPFLLVPEAERRR